MHDAKRRRIFITLANAVELATEATYIVLGNDCDNTVNGCEQTKQLLADNVATRLASHIQLKTGV